MKLNGNSLDEVLMKETLSDEDIVFLLGLTEPEDCKKLQEAAYKKTTELMGNKVYYRGLIEVSNVCTVDCRYCGIRKDNYGVHRYTLTKDEILGAAMFAAENGYGSICLQAGERNDPKFISFISDCLREIHRKTVSESLLDGLGITLSLGDQTKNGRKPAATARIFVISHALKALITNFLIFFITFLTRSPNIWSIVSSACSGLKSADIRSVPA